jgi:hypothetical protein
VLRISRFENSHAENVQVTLPFLQAECSAWRVKSLFRVAVCLVLLSGVSSAASKPHTVEFGKWTTVQILAGEDENTPIEMKIRPLLIDGRVKEFTTGAFHDVTDRLFVVQRAYRLNDLLPQESGPNRWRWERGGWLRVDRVSAKVQNLALPAFDAFYSQVSWFRDYAAYCGASGDGQRYTVVAQLGRRKPLLKKAFGEKGSSMACPAPQWSRAPARATFHPAGEDKFTFTVRSHAVDLVSEDDGEGEN